MLPLPVRIPTATYRFQFTPEFGFDHARALAPYLSKLGISEVYASPLFQASSASTHGYDVNDPNQFSAALGGKEGFEKFSKALKAEDLGLLVDFVPNHMGIDGEFNWRWQDVLENGENSRFARYFDIEWQPRLDRLKDRVLVPILGAHYGAVLEKGELALSYAEGRFFIRYYRFRLPLRPRSYGVVLQELIGLLPADDERRLRLRSLSDAFENLPVEDSEQREVLLHKTRDRLRELLAADDTLQARLDQVLKKFNGVPGDPATVESLHTLLEGQHYRLAFWKVGAHEVNYRRFFAVDTLVGLKMEEPEVFDATHRLLGDLVSRNAISGIRLDHIDGLWNPAQYLERLAELVRRKLNGGGPLYTLVEKILASDETLPAKWAVHGTTGYEFCANLIELFLDRADEPAWTRIYGDFTGERESSPDLTYQDKLFVLQEIFPNAIIGLAMELDALIDTDWHWRDLSLREIETGLLHLLACLLVYRTYRAPDRPMVEDEKKWVRQAVHQAIARNPSTDPASLRFLASVVMGDYPPAGASAEQKQAIANWVCKLQQATGAVMAKSVEDTHFYRYVRMFGANEVGSHPSRFGQPVEEFHRINQQRLEQAPLNMLATSTHDTKISEDCRARLFALAELPAEWETHLNAWHKITQAARNEVDGREAPDRQEEYLLYQLLLAAWPLKMQTPDDAFRQRIQSCFHKAQAEAKRNTTWTYPHKSWETATGSFIDAVLASPEFLKDFVPFAERIAARGMIYSLAQTVLKLTSPGVPDIYQGNELWDFSLVDPDNRRAVDYEARKALLANLDKRTPDDLLENWTDGAIKMKIIQSILTFRREFPQLFTLGQYEPLEVRGEHATQVIAFLRKHESSELLVVVPRRLGQVESWRDTRLPLRPSRWKNILTGAPLEVAGEDVPLSEIFAEWPLAVLQRT
jgi:(1->4)-alpha-D-glucan 1-alpha-D-glucosylmutase